MTRQSNHYALKAETLKEQKKKKKKKQKKPQKTKKTKTITLSMIEYRLLFCASLKHK